MKLNKRETATVLAALRYWQQDLLIHGIDDIIDTEHFHDVMPLDSDQIDALCERINCEEDDAATALIKNAVNRWGEEIENDEPIHGSDAVDWLFDFYEEATAVLSKDSEVGVPCVKCGRTDLPLHYNRVCGVCFVPEGEES